MTASSARRTQLAAIVVEWDGLSAYTKRRLSVPIAWRGKSAERLRWYAWDQISGGRFFLRDNVDRFPLAAAWVVLDSDHHAEVMDVANLAGANPRVVQLAGPYRRTPNGGAWLVPDAPVATRDHVQIYGTLHLGRGSSGQWRKGRAASTGGAPWPNGASPQLGASIAPCEDWNVAAVAAPYRYVVEQSIVTWLSASAHTKIADAIESAKAHARSIGFARSVRVRDLGTRTTPLVIAKRRVKDDFALAAAPVLGAFDLLDAIESLPVDRPGPPESVTTG